MQDILKKPQNLVEKAKIQTLIATKTVRKDALFTQLGKAIYNQADSEEIDPIVAEIREIEDEILELNDDLNALSNKVRCDGCGNYFDANMAYCGHCGTKKPEPPVEETPDEEPCSCDCACGCESTNEEPKE